ncbi:unnamed protein product [Citrullus colocynthis]|uniref:Uncharacterized protein n=1 Tax=Citrullus colocynthis TaxID=252529 RepID=A0ABP0YFI3_9ROSI
MDILRNFIPLFCLISSFYLMENFLNGIRFKEKKAKVEETWEGTAAAHEPDFDFHLNLILQKCLRDSLHQITMATANLKQLRFGSI